MFILYHVLIIHPCIRYIRYKYKISKTKILKQNLWSIPQPLFRPKVSANLKHITVILISFARWRSANFSPVTTAIVGTKWVILEIILLKYNVIDFFMILKIIGDVYDIKYYCNHFYVRKFYYDGKATPECLFEKGLTKNGSENIIYERKYRSIAGTFSFARWRSVK